MKFCIHCGKQNQDSAAFCAYCGGKQPAISAPQAPVLQATAPVQPVQAQPVQPTPVPPVMVAPVRTSTRDFSAIKVRYRCPSGHVFNGPETQTACPTCGAMLPKGGYIQLYRMGNMMGVTVGMGIHINEQPCGHIGNKESIRISVPYGQYKVHVTHTTTRRCNDPIVTVDPAHPTVFLKAHFVKGGWAIGVDVADEAEMPER